MTDTYTLEMIMKKRHVTNKDVAKAIGISENAFIMKKKNKTEFTAGEIDACVEFLNLPDREIFFKNEV